MSALDLAAPRGFRPASGWFRRLNPAARISALVLMVYALAALTAPLWLPYDPYRIMVGPRHAAPSLSHLLGTDALGRDIFSRVVQGSRPVFLLTLATTTIAVGGGAFIGILCAWRRGISDQIAMRLTDVLIAIPPLIIALLLLGVLGNSAPVLIGTVALIYLIRTARIIRAAALAVVTEDYITAATLRGDSTGSILWVEILPNVLGTVLVEFAVRAGFVIVFFGALGFLGFGAAPPSPEWGVMINEGRDALLQSVWPVLGPAGAMAILVVALNLLTDGISRSLSRGREGGAS